MKPFFFTLFFSVCFHLAFAQTITYPVASVRPVTEEFYNKYKIIDDYRWMENLRDPELKKWVNDENKISNQFINRASGKNNTYRYIDGIANVIYKDPVKKGKYYFTYAYQNDYDVPALFVQNTIKDNDPTIIVDPNFISHKDKIVLKDYEVSADSKYLAYEFSRNGSDWAEIMVTVIRGQSLDDHLVNVKFSNIAWQSNGFFYSTYPPVSNMGKTQGQTVYYHKIGTPQSSDSLIFKRNDPNIRFNFLTTSDSRFFVLSEHNPNTGKNNYFYIDYKDAEPTLKPLLLNLKFAIDVIDSHNGKLIATTLHEADNGSIVEIDPANPREWKPLAPSYSEAVLMKTVPLKDKIISVYQAKLHPEIVATDYDGKVLGKRSFPIGTSIRGLRGLPDDKELSYSYQSYTRPPVVFSINTDNYVSTLTRPSTVRFDYENFVYQESEYVTHDSVKVPILLIYKKGLKLNGNNPTLLEAYGGFGVINTPSFDPGIVYFLNNGGVYAYACIRGGGELGNQWAKGGKGLNKQNSFNDFISGAEYLIKQGYTSPAKLAISGASNGGLVVAEAAIQRPDLFKAAIPVVAPLDMLRFENFTVGQFHTGEYGSVADSAGFKQLYNYSPYNNIKANVNYPSMLIITSENDDRVPPLHSFKFTAKLQSRPVQTNPILLLVNKQAGHYGTGDNSLVAELEEKASLYAFIIETLK
ncbi:prolyl oligopeptidase family serine peptidase [Mucilaginibacter pineti]|nr:prolyl oligopeptidase family serine peptidase [Mucilaginibacter pineti]